MRYFAILFENVQLIHVFCHKGTGHAGLIFLYRVTGSQNESQLKFVQFKSDDDGKKLKATSAKSGPSGKGSQFSPTSIEVVVGDLDGDGYLIFTAENNPLY